MRGVSISVSFLAAFALVTPAFAGHGAHLVIAEVQVGGAAARDEFVELYNPTNAAIPLEGWRLSKRTGTGAREENLVTAFAAITVAAHASVLVAPSDGAFGAQADVAYTTQSSLGADNTVILYGPLSGETRPIVDLVGFGSAVSREGTAASNPTNSQSIERKPGGSDGNGVDTDDNGADFAIVATPTPQGASANARPPLTPATVVEAPSTPVTTITPTTPADVAPATESSPKTEIPETPTATNVLVAPSPMTGALPQPTHVRINEFVADPASGDEWIELVNIGSVPVNLADWILEDGAETRTPLVGAVGVGDHRFTVITKPKGQLNNTGDRITLKSARGDVVDAVTYGDWNDGKVSDNAPVAADPASVARVVDGADSGDDRLDFVRTETPTPGLPNIVASVPVESDVAADRPRTTGAPRAIVVLNELFPNPPGEDLTDEYIELANIWTERVDLAGWRLRDDLGAEYVIAAADGATAIEPNGFLTFPRARTGIALNNTGGETVRLLASGSERAASVAEYHGVAEEHVSWARTVDGRWAWTTQRTPNAVNAIAAVNRPPDAVVAAPDGAAPRAVVTFDASDSADPDRDPLTFDNRTVCVHRARDVHCDAHGHGCARRERDGDAPHHRSPRGRTSRTRSHGARERTRAAALRAPPEPYGG